MSWTELLNHDQAKERFRRSIANRRLASTYLFVGKPGIGKRRFAMQLAECLLCERPRGELDSCGECPACQQVRSETHPDLILISKAPDKAVIPVDTFIGDEDHRRQRGLIHDLGLKPFRGGRKIAIIDDADCLNQDGANSLLKTLEEPPPNSLLILIGTSEQRQLKTILSRSQIVRFEPLTEEQVNELLERFEVETPISKLQLARLAEGSISRALKLADPDLFEFREQLLGQLASGDPGQGDFTKTMQTFVDGAGTESTPKRERLHFLADLVVSFFRDCYLRLATAGGQSATDDAPDPHVHKLTSSLAGRPLPLALEICTESIDRTLELQFQVSANVANLNAIDGWLIQLGRIFRTRS